ncbi:MAG: hypothetical protein JNK85_05455 [Verrucomicrobiales bacterium]|nr:hypothetical protein [Verrucomicrobiales bacterium]
MSLFSVRITSVGMLASALILPAGAAVDFAKEVAPILQKHCVECHGAEKQKGKLRLDTQADLMKGGKGGPSVKAGDAAASELHRRVALPKEDDDHMPPEGLPLSAEEIAILKNWINEGANWPEGLVLKGAGDADAKPTAAAPASSAPAKPAVPEPELPKDFKPAAAETDALAALAKAGIDVRPIAQNIPWREVNLRPLGTSVTDQVIAPLKDVTSLTEARLGGTKITDAGLVALKGLPYLQVLGLELTAITDAGVAHLAGLKNLTSLNLYGTGVSDAALVHLEGMKHLRNLYLWQTKVTPEGTKKLQEALPGLNINTGIVLSAATTNAPAEKKEEPKK